MPNSEKISLHGFTFNLSQKISKNGLPLVDLVLVREPANSQVRRIGTAADLANRALRDVGHDHVPLDHLTTFVRGIGYVAREHGFPVGRIVTPIQRHH